MTETGWPTKHNILLSGPLHIVCQPLPDVYLVVCPVFVCVVISVAWICSRHDVWLHYGHYSRCSNILIESVKINSFAIYLELRDQVSGSLSSQM